MPLIHVVEILRKHVTERRAPPKVASCQRLRVANMPLSMGSYKRQKQQKASQQKASGPGEATPLTVNVERR
jgi:hypothetical protein